MPVDLSNLANPSYVDRVNRAVDYVTAHLADRIRLGDVAQAACLSPFTRRYPLPTAGLARAAGRWENGHE